MSKLPAKRREVTTRDVDDVRAETLHLIVNRPAQAEPELAQAERVAVTPRGHTTRDSSDTCRLPNRDKPHPVDIRAAEVLVGKAERDHLDLMLPPKLSEERS